MKIILLLALVLIQPLAALTIRIDYTYDTTNFFNTQAKRDAIESVAAFYGDMIHDSLLRIDPADFPGCSWTANPFHPATGATLSIPGLVVPEDTIIVYVGARTLGGTTRGLGGPGGWGGSANTILWFDRIQARGNAGAVSSNPASRTDFAPWGGSISFDIGSTWNFSRTQNLAGVDFIKIALHEMGHVLGIGTADSWNNQISGGVFNGSAAFDSYSSNPPVQSGGGHFQNPVPSTDLFSPAFGSFGMAHGSSRPVLMLPSSIDDGVHLDVASDLDLAALVDIGWQVVPRPALTINALGPASSSFTFPTSTFIDYKIQRGINLQSFPGGSASIIGNGLNQSWTDPAPPATAAFYRLSMTPRYSAPAAMSAAASSRTLQSVMTASEAPRWVEGCGE